MYCIFQKGHSEGFGDNNNTITVAFVEKGLLWKSNGRTFGIKMSGVSAQLESWSGHTPLKK